MKKIITLSLLTFIACSSYNKIEITETAQSFICFSSFLDNEILTVSVNDVIKYDEKSFVLNKSLGILSDAVIKTKAQKIKLKMSFTGYPFKDLDPNLPPRIINDTRLIKKSKGRYIMIRILMDRIEVKQQNTPFILD